MTETQEPQSSAVEVDEGVFESAAVIDNGRFGTRTIRFETGRLAQQAQAPSPPTSTRRPCCCRRPPPASTPKEHFDFFPLTVDVEERMYAAGRIPGSFFRREGRPSTDAILTCRLIDRPLRPSFVDGLRNEVQIVVTVLSLRPDEFYDVARDQRRVGVDPDLRPAVLRPASVRASR